MAMLLAVWFQLKREPDIRISASPALRVCGLQE